MARKPKKSTGKPKKTGRNAAPRDKKQQAQPAPAKNWDSDAKKRRPTKKKPNLLPVFTVLLLLFVAAGICVLVYSFGAAASEGHGTAGRELDEPEFFATMRPLSTSSPSLSAGETMTAAFSDTLIVGDSLTAQLASYVKNHPSALSNARFLTSDSYSWAKAQEEPVTKALSLEIAGSRVSLVEALLRTDAKRLYIQLGMQDIRDFGENDAASSAMAVLGSLHRDFPELEITVMSVTPLLEWIEYDGLSNDAIAIYNQNLQEFCAGTPNCAFLDVNALCPDGYLPAEYCADAAQLCIHWNDTGCARWAELLLSAKTEPAATASPAPENPDGETPEDTDAGETDETDAAGDGTDGAETDETDENNGETGGE